MINTGKLAGRTVFITGASRGIGKTIALKVAKDGANVVIAAKTAEPHPKLPGTIYTACEEVEKAGGKGLPCVVDIRDELQVRTAVEEAVKKFGGIDVLINNASAISLTPTHATGMKRYDLMHSVNTRGTFLVSKECLPHLKKSNHAHILTLSPPLSMAAHWFRNHVAYTIAKYGMSMCVLGMSDEFKPFNIAVNALWPRTAIYTAALEMLISEESAKFCRKPEIVADAAYAILCRDPNTTTGNFFVDDDVLKQNGVTNFDEYAIEPSNRDNLILDSFLDCPAKDVAPVHGTIGDNQSNRNLKDVFKAIEDNLSLDIVQQTQAVLQFVIFGNEAGKWYIDLKNGKGTCGSGEAPTHPDATLTMDNQNFFDLFSGNLKPGTGLMTGRVKINGSIQKALKLDKLLSSLKLKL